MSYAAGVAHYHRLPLAKSIFQSLLEKLISKMLRREVWGYWYLTSQSGILVNPSLKELRKPWADPVVKENIMYSGHLLLMVSLYSMLFDSEKYDLPGSLTFHYDPIFYGFGPEKFEYERMSLQNAILAEFEKNEFLGVCCEPNCIFVICNQFPFIAMRYNDVRNGTNVVGPVLEKYVAEWEKRGMFDEQGNVVDMWLIEQKMRVSRGQIWTSAWYIL